MRISKAVGSLMAIGLLIAAVGTTSSPAQADDNAPCAAPKVTCAGGKIHVTATDSACTINGAAPWKWSGDAKLKATFEGCNAENHCSAANLTATSCDGTVKVFQCKASHCDAPVSVPVPKG